MSSTFRTVAVVDWFRTGASWRMSSSGTAYGDSVEPWTLTATLPLAAGISWAQIAERSPVTAPTTY
ncbi:hypothetical protein [Rhodococcus jostii]|uniref:hypothetical protein n=1 Tax=Rhodococcus jostii TaxID=132919 RepID=UPI0011D1011A|nr:hypothetical protein [Rhodococcus jostii]